VLDTVHRATNQEILQPIIGVALAAETLGWPGLPSVFAHRLRRRWTKVPQQGQSPHAALSRVGHAVQRVGLNKGPIQKLPQPLHPSAGAMRLWVSIALTALLALAAPGHGMALPHARWEGCLGPWPQAPQTLGKSPFARGVRRLPPPLLALSTHIAQRLGGSSTDVEQRRENTQDDREVGA
jgi:hypothetical protein